MKKLLVFLFVFLLATAAYAPEPVEEIDCDEQLTECKRLLFDSMLRGDELQEENDIILGELDAVRTTSGVFNGLSFLKSRPKLRTTVFIIATSVFGALTYLIESE